MKFILSLILALCALSAQAVQFEAGLGVSRTQPQPNGTWYQEGFPHKLDLNHASWYIGVREQVRPRLSVHADYVSFGIIHADAIATPVDSNYDPATHSCVGKCVAESRFVGSGRSDGLKLAAQWAPTDNGFSLIGGLLVFRPRWKTTIFGWTPSVDVPPRTIEHSIKQRWTVRPVIGVAYRKDGWELRLEQYFNKPYDSSNTALTRGTMMLSLGYSF